MFSIAIALSLFCCVVYDEPRPFASSLVLNERLIEYWDSAGVDSGLQESTPHAYLRGSMPVDIADPDTVLRFILSSIDTVVDVYPTERYYYYKFNVGEKIISGNIRFADAEDGVVHIGYFNQNDQSEIYTKSYSAGDETVDILYDPAGATVRLNAFGLCRVFELNQADLMQNVAVKTSEAEDFVSGICDESGYRFDLVFNREFKYFYYILDESMLPEPIYCVDSDAGNKFSVGLRSRFIFYHDQELKRKILVGVSAENVMKNNYYDGPFDQVPPRLPLKPLLVEAYPYVQYGGGIDLHGNFLARDHQRVAISPYQQYSTLREGLGTLDKLLRQFEADEATWVHACYEWKRDFHKTLPEYKKDRRSMIDYTHNIDISRRWPANHWASMSFEWPPEHDFESSHRAGANAELGDGN